MKKSIYVLVITFVIATLVISSTANKTDYFSIPGGAFNPASSSMTYTNDGIRILGQGEFYAPVYLPNEAKVTKLLFFWSDYYGADDGTLSLERYSFGSPTSQTMAEASTSGSTGSGASEDTSIDNEEIDNSQYSYFVALDFPASTIICYNVVIEYNYEPLSASANMIYEENHVSNVNKSPVLIEQ